MSEMAQRQEGELKPHGDELESALKPLSDEHTTNTQQKPAESRAETKE